MTLYNIHTHDIPTSGLPHETVVDVVKSIVNLYPTDIDNLKATPEHFWYSCGIHPWYSTNFEVQLKLLTEIATNPRIVAIGETGFDKIRGLGLAEQTFIFEQHINLSEELHKPLIIHCVKAWNELIYIKQKYKPQQPWIIHGYRGKPQLTKQLVNHNFYFSLGEKFNLESVRILPPNRIFCETDDSSKDIYNIYSQIAPVLNTKTDTFAEQVGYNIQEVFPSII